MSDWFYLKLAGAIVLGLGIAFVVVTDLIDRWQRWRRPKDEAIKDQPE